MTAFVDTFALIAWMNRRDAAHSVVSTYLEGFAGKLVTTEWVLMEFADAFAAPGARDVAAEFLRAVRADPTFDVIGYEQVRYNAGFDLYASRSDKSWSLTDCISFAVMSERGIIDALTADRHFEQAGFRAVFAGS
jgi:uncharacterized protein